MGFADLVLSTNRKTCRSLNTGHSTCAPTSLCNKLCYGRYVGAKTAKQEGIHANVGPITKQGNCYERNASLLHAHRSNEAWLERQAFRLKHELDKDGLNNLRLCGMGDLTIGTCKIAVLLDTILKKHTWGFSKRHVLIKLLAKLCDDLNAPMQSRPYIIGSTDCSMTHVRVKQLIKARERLNGVPRLAYMTTNPGWVAKAEISSLPMWWSKHITVVFGYHTSHCKTVVDHELACPSTNGEDITCQVCRRCMGK